MGLHGRVWVPELPERRGKGRGRGRHTQRDASRKESARARNAVGQRPGPHVLTSQRCIHVKESQVTCNLRARKLLLLAAGAVSRAESRSAWPCDRRHEHGTRG